MAAHEPLTYYVREDPEHLRSWDDGIGITLVGEIVDTVGSYADVERTERGLRTVESIGHTTLSDIEISDNPEQ